MSSDVSDSNEAGVPKKTMYVRQVRRGSLTLTEWKRDGEVRGPSIVLQRGIKDKKTGEWDNSRRFGLFVNRFGDEYLMLKEMIAEFDSKAVNVTKE